MNKHLVLILGIATLVGCNTTTSQVECDNAIDWLSLSSEVALAGKSVREFDKYKASCCDNLPGNAQALYLDGYTAGIKQYCSYENGFKLGEKGIPDPQICPLEIRAEFDKGFRIGALERREKQQNRELAEREKDRALISSDSAMSSVGG